MGDGITLAQFYLSEALRLSDAATVSAEIERAETLRAWLLEAFPHREVTVRDVVQLGPNALREGPKARAAIGLLVAHHWLAPLEKGTVIRGAARLERKRGALWGWAMWFDVQQAVAQLMGGDLPPATLSPATTATAATWRSRSGPTLDVVAGVANVAASPARN